MRAERETMLASTLLEESRVIPLAYNESLQFYLAQGVSRDPSGRRQPSVPEASSRASASTHLQFLQVGRPDSSASGVSSDTKPNHCFLSQLSSYLPSVETTTLRLVRASEGGRSTTSLDVVHDGDIVFVTAEPSRTSASTFYLSQPERRLGSDPLQYDPKANSCVVTTTPSDRCKWIIRRYSTDKQKQSARDPIYVRDCVFFESPTDPAVRLRAFVLEDEPSTVRDTDDATHLNTMAPYIWRISLASHPQVLSRFLAHHTSHSKSLFPTIAPEEAFTTLASLPIDAAEAILVDECLTAMLGEPAPLGMRLLTELKHSASSGAAAAKPNIPPMLVSFSGVLEPILTLCENVRIVATFAETRHSVSEFGRVSHAFAAALMQLVREFYLLNTQLETQFKVSGLSLLRLCHYVQPCAPIFAKLRSICALATYGASLRAGETALHTYAPRSIPERGPLTGGNLLTLLYVAAVQEGDATTRATMTQLFAISAKSYHDILACWLRTGRLEDPCKEFFIYSTSSPAQQASHPGILIDTRDDGQFSASQFSDNVTFEADPSKVPSYLHGCQDKVLRTGRLVRTISQYAVLARNGVVNAQSRAWAREEGDEMEDGESSEDEDTLTESDSRQTQNHKPPCVAEIYLDEHLHNLSNSLTFVDDIQPVIQAIEAAYTHAARAMHLLLEKDLKMYKHLSAMTGFFFFGKTHVIDQFVDLAASELSKDAHSLDVSRLNALLGFAMRATGQSGSYTSRLGCALVFPRQASKRESENQLTRPRGMDVITLSYNCPWPLCPLVVSQESKAKYQLIFRNLFFIRHVSRQLSEAFTALLSLKQLPHHGALVHLRPCLMIRQRLQHYVDSLFYYITARVLLPNFEQFIAQLQSSGSSGRDNNLDVEDPEQIPHMHDAFLDKCLKECLLVDDALWSLLLKLLRYGLYFADKMKKIVAAVHHAANVDQITQGSAVLTKQQQSLNPRERRQSRLHTQSTSLASVLADSENRTLINQLKSALEERTTELVTRLKEQTGERQDHFLNSLLAGLDFNDFYSHFAMKHPRPLKSSSSTSALSSVAGTSTSSSSAKPSSQIATAPSTGSKSVVVDELKTRGESRETQAPQALADNNQDTLSVLLAKKANLSKSGTDAPSTSLQNTLSTQVPATVSSSLPASTSSDYERKTKQDSVAAPSVVTTAAMSTTATAVTPSLGASSPTPITTTTVAKTVTAEVSTSSPQDILATIRQRFAQHTSTLDASKVKAEAVTSTESAGQGAAPITTSSGFQPLPRVSNPLSFTTGTSVGKTTASATGSPATSVQAALGSTSGLSGTPASGGLSDALAGIRAATGGGAYTRSTSLSMATGTTTTTTTTSTTAATTRTSIFSAGLTSTLNPSTPLSTVVNRQPYSQAQQHQSQQTSQQGGSNAGADTPAGPSLQN